MLQRLFKCLSSKPHNREQNFPQCILKFTQNLPPGIYSVAFYVPFKQDKLNYLGDTAQNQNEGPFVKKVWSFLSDDRALNQALSPG